MLVETESQKQILVGKGGAMVREIGTRARPEIEQLLGHKVFLELQVEGAAEVAPGRDDARAPRHVKPRAAGIAASTPGARCDSCGYARAESEVGAP